MSSVLKTDTAHPRPGGKTWLNEQPLIGILLVGAACLGTGWAVSQNVSVDPLRQQLGERDRKISELEREIERMQRQSQAVDHDPTTVDVVTQVALRDAANRLSALRSVGVQKVNTALVVEWKDALLREFGELDHARIQKALTALRSVQVDYSSGHASGDELAARYADIIAPLLRM